MNADSEFVPRDPAAHPAAVTPIYKTSVYRGPHARQLHDAALDRVHQAEIGHNPREERAFLIAGAAQEEGRGG